MIINNKEYVLVTYINNSAPCSKCAFFDHNSLHCKFPEKYNKECEHNPGTLKGWNTKEYRRFIKS